jgi:glycosyltransferase involved in cell wall biosynthesis
MESEDFEVVIQDNSDENSEYLQACGSITDHRLRYYYDPARLSISENCERGLSLARGSFVCMIADDDAVTESIIDLARWMEASGIEAAATVYPTYLWPGVGSVLDGTQVRGILRLPRYTGGVEYINASEALDVVLSSGGITLGDLPSVYAGVISKRVLDKLKSTRRHVFPRPESGYGERDRRGRFPRSLRTGQRSNLRSRRLSQERLRGGCPPRACGRGRG